MRSQPGRTTRDAKCAIRSTGVSLLAFLAAFSAGCASAKTEVAGDRPAALAAQAFYCMIREDTAHAVFRGCIDWHSSVHAVWAMTAYARMSGNQQFVGPTAALLTADGLAEELDFVRTRPEFERPYGRAWFLRLATEWAMAGQDARLMPLAQEISTSLVAHYKAEPPRPSARDYQNDAWALINLLAYARQTGDAETVAFVGQLTRAHFMGEARCDLTREAPGFLSSCLVWAWLVSEVASAAEFRAWYPAWDPGLAALAPIAAPSGAHQYGKNFSRAWGYGALALKTRDPAFEAAYCAHVDAGYRQWSAMRDDYGAVGHWVAQFGMLALQRGRDAGIDCPD